MNTASAIAANLQAVREHLGRAARAAGRDPEAVRLVAVSKTFGADAVLAACAAGQRHFGENRVQEAARKFPALRAQVPELRLHLIGGLQSNKARDAVRLVDVIESLDRTSLVDALAGAIQKEGRAPQLLIQVNIGREPQKGGCDPDAAEALRDACAAKGLAIAGLMCIPPAEDEPAPHFRTLAALGARMGLDWLSMGMSGDYRTAIECGSTEVRVGSAIFGAR
ncbi:MAG: YggS family pyridoxal phosphate-dependent enzyme [Acetobacteraceae bacterium]|nr:YggS family pyridoxal phosphate-dependent enzyme [Acetobacteraceae bacterium]